jgi:hypothetical protein
VQNNEEEEEFGMSLNAQNQFTNFLMNEFGAKKTVKKENLLFQPQSLSDY